MTDLQILHDSIMLDRESDLSLQEQALLDEYAFKPYVDEKVPMVDFGSVELQNL